jgi:hypothetical protein
VVEALFPRPIACAIARTVATSASWAALTALIAASPTWRGFTRSTTASVEEAVGVGAVYALSPYLLSLQYSKVRFLLRRRNRTFEYCKESK